MEGHTAPTCPNVTKEQKVLKRQKDEQEKSKNTPLDNSANVKNYDDDGTDDDEEAVKRDAIKFAEHLEKEFVESDDDSGVEVVLETPIHVAKIEKINVLRSGGCTTEGYNDLPDFKPDRTYKVGPNYAKRDHPRPVDVVKLLWNEEIMNTFLVNTNAYANSKNDPEWPRNGIEMPELYRFFGLLLFFGALEVAERRLVWDMRSKFFNKFVAMTMSRHRFEVILRNLHWFNTCSVTPEDRKARNKVDCFWRVAPLLDKLAKGYRKHYNCGQALDCDEQEIPSKAYHSAIQYNGDKPYKWFFKVYALNDSKSRYMSNFYLFRGADKN